MDSGVLLGLLFGRALPIEPSFAEDAKDKAAPIAPSSSISAIPHEGDGNGRVWEMDHKLGRVRVCRHPGNFEGGHKPECSGWSRGL